MPYFFEAKRGNVSYSHYNHYLYARFGSINDKKEEHNAGK